MRACAPMAVLQEPSSAVSAPRSAATAMTLGRWMSAASQGASASSARTSMASAPCPGAGGCSTGSRMAVARWARPSRFRPASARMMASASPASSLARRVSTLPRKLTSCRSGRMVQRLRLAAQRGRAQHRALRQCGQRCGLVADEDVARILALAGSRR